MRLQPFEAFNVATGDYVTVKEIADLACSCLGLRPEEVRYHYTGGDRGWKGDVPVVRLSNKKITGLGWRPTRTAAEALRQAMLAMMADLEAGYDTAPHVALAPLLASSQSNSAGKRGENAAIPPLASLDLEPACSAEGDALIVACLVRCGSVWAAAALICRPITVNMADS